MTHLYIKVKQQYTHLQSQSPQLKPSVTTPVSSMLSSADAAGAASSDDDASNDDHKSVDENDTKIFSSLKYVYSVHI